MTNDAQMPDRIWAWQTEQGENGRRGQWFLPLSGPETVGFTEYVRADLCASGQVRTLTDEPIPAPTPPQSNVSVADCEEVAFALWCEEAGNTTLRRHRTRKGWDDQSEDTRERFFRFADAALRALKGGQ